MIGSIRGKVLDVRKDGLLLEVSGVGYIVRTTTEAIAKAVPGSEFALRTHLAVREDALDLFGFESQDEVALFELFIGISGIGPKSALGIMNLADVRTLRNAIGSGDTQYLTRVSGIGKKIAEKIVLELRDKLGSSSDDSPLLREDTDVLQALEALGYGRAEARETLKLVPKDVRGTNERLKEVLKMLGKG